MIRVRRSDERGHFNYGWLDTRHTFSFAEYMDPKHMGFRALRVINEDTVGAGKGFPTHPHRDMEIITYVLEGSVQHKDSMGNGSVIRPGDVQRMSAGTGVTHSEFNPSDKEDLHLLQIWILPEAQGIKPGYEQKMFKKEDKLNRLRLVASGRPAEGAVKVHQDVGLYAAVLDKGAQVSHEMKNTRHAWLQLARGSVSLNGHALGSGDGAAVSDEKSLKITAEKEAEVLLFDMA